MGLIFFNKTHNGYTVRPLTTKDVSQAVRLQRKWIKYKLDNYVIFNILFSHTKYERCMLNTFDEAVRGKIITLGAFDSEGLLVAYRTIYRKGNQGYDLAYITNRELGICDFGEFFEIESLRQLKEKYGIIFFNCGIAQIYSGNLKGFKSHLPHKYNSYYQYTLNQYEKRKRT